MDKKIEIVRSNLTCAEDMVDTSIGFHAVLLGKEKPPLRTGNPPGELVGG